MAEIYSSLYKGLVHVTTPFSISHKALDIGNYKVKNNVYSANKLGSGTVQSVATSYKSPATGLTYQNSLVVWIKYDNGMRCGMYHGEVGDRVVSVGDRVTAGMQVYKTGNTGNSTGDHLHYNLQNSSGVNIDPAPWVLNDQNAITFKVGDKVKATNVQNIRKGAGDKFEITGETVIDGTATIKDGPRSSQNKLYGLGENDSYIWYDLQFNMGTGWIADVNKMEKYTEPVPPVVEPPVTPPDALDCDEYIKKVELLQKENDGLKIDVESLRNENKLLDERATFLENTMAIRDGELRELEAEIIKIREERDRFEKQYIDVVTELNELKKGRDDWISRMADVLHKLFGMK